MEPYTIHIPSRRDGLQPALPCAKDNALVRMFGWHEFKAELTASPHVGKNVYGSTCDYGHTRFHHYPTYPDALAAMDSGWDEPLGKKFRGLLDMSNCEQMPDVQIEESPVGMSPHVPNFLCGNPHDMHNLASHPEGEPCLTIYTTAATRHCKEPAAKVIREGQEIVRRAHACEERGVRTRIVVFSAVDGDGDGLVDPTLRAKLVAKKNGDGYYIDRRDWRDSRAEWGHMRHMVTGVVVKDFNEPFDLSRLMFGLANPDFLRRLMFRLIETTMVNLKRGERDDMGRYKLRPTRRHGFPIVDTVIDEVVLPRMHHDSKFVFVGKGDNEDRLGRIEKKASEDLQ